MIERIHRKILRTIQGLPIRCPFLALTSLIGSLGLCFINSIAHMSAEDLPKRVLLERLLLDKDSGLLKTWSALVSTHPFPPLLTMVSNGKSKDSFKAAARKSMLIGQYIALVDSCSNLPISSLPAHMGKPSSLWLCSLKDRSLHGSSNFRIRLLTGCDGLELDASRFRSRNRFNAAPGDASCKLCHLDVESPSHFLSGCSALSPLRDTLISAAPACVRAHLDQSSSHKEALCSLVLGLDWLSDSIVRRFGFFHFSTACVKPAAIYY